MISTEIAYMAAIEMAAAIRERQLSPVEVVDALLARIERVNPPLNAFTVVLAEQARAAARQAEAAVIAGGKLGPLHGVPFTIKDLSYTRGVLTTRGSKAFADYIPDENAVFVDRLLDAGGIFLAKTTTPEFGNKGVTESPLLGVTNNPWNTARTAGGSSGGAAVQVAAGMGPLAHGSDGAGSIRIPASLCGVVGLKPSYGRVPAYPPTQFATIAHQGPITRTVADAALMLSVMAGPDDRDPFSLTDRNVDYVSQLAGASVRGLRVAYSRDLGGIAPVLPEVTALTDAAARTFEAMGARVEEVAPDIPDPRGPNLTIWSVTYATTVREVVLPRGISLKDLDPMLVRFYEMGSKVSAVDYQATFLFRSELYRRMIAFHETYDLLLTPTLATPAFPHPGWLAGPETLNGQPIDPLLGWLLTYPFNLTGQPAITVPCGFTAEGLPVGLQIVGRRHADIDVLRAAAAYEQAAPWADRRPPVE